MSTQEDIFARNGTQGSGVHFHARWLVFDLDGTLVRTDTLVESLVQLLLHRPLAVFVLVTWMLKGRAEFKRRVAALWQLNVDQLPYEESCLRLLEQARAGGFRLMLATAADISVADQVAQHLGPFDRILASDGNCNLKGAAKAAAIREALGDEPFVYVGDSRDDAAVWEVAKQGVYVNAPRILLNKAAREGRMAMEINSKVPLWKALLSEARPHQWAKNLLAFVPLLVSHSYLDVHALQAVLVAFMVFSLCASGVYFLNDLVDLEADRRHPAKRHRPLASGNLPLGWGVAGALLLPLLAFLFSWHLLPPDFLLALGGYFLLTMAYSLYLKRHSTIDVMALGALYTLRLVAGAFAIAVPVSAWLLAFSMFLFLSLAYLKRYVETAALLAESGPAPGRGYSAVDTETMFVLGTSNMTAAVLVLALYVSTPEVTRMYASPGFLWGLCLLLLFWGNRLWVGARRGKISEDPVSFAIRDRLSIVLGVLSVLIVLAAR